MDYPGLNNQSGIFTFPDFIAGACQGALDVLHEIDRGVIGRDNSG
jgi:hypothetical protein